MVSVCFAQNTASQLLREVLSLSQKTSVSMHEGKGIFYRMQLISNALHGSGQVEMCGALR